MNKLLTTIQKQEELIRYIEQNEWKTDFEKKQLEALIEQIQLSCGDKFEIDEFISLEQQEMLKSFIFDKQQKIRAINRNLQEILHQSIEIKQPSQCVLAQLPPRLKNNKDSYIHSLMSNLFKSNLMEIRNCFNKLTNIIEIPEKMEPIKKSINLLQIAENFKFELSCLENELAQNRQLIGNQFQDFRNQIDLILDNKQLQKLISFCTSLTKVKLHLKKQRLLAKQFFVIEISSLQDPESDKENKQASYSQETDYTSQQSPQKLIDLQKPRSQNIKDEACLCQIF